MDEHTEIPNVSMTNTKKELLDAYEAAKERLQDLNRELLDAEKVKNRLEKQAAAVTADAQAAQDPLQRLHDLRGAISRELTDLAERFEVEIETYRKIQSAVEAKQEELKIIYEVETAVSDLAALIDAQRAEKERSGREMKAEKDTFEEEMGETRAQWGRQKAEHDRQGAEQAESIKKQRQREKEEYEYAFARDTEQRKNAIEDELGELKKEIARKQAEFEHSNQQRTAELGIREETLTKREKEMGALQIEVDTFPKRLENAVQVAVDNTTGELTRDFEKDKALMESKFEGGKNVLTGKIESLEKVVASQAAQIADLSKRQEQAYEKVQDIANRAVAAAKRESYPPSFRSGSSSPVRDENQDG